LPEKIRIESEISTEFEDKCVKKVFGYVWIYRKIRNINSHGQYSK